MQHHGNNQQQNMESQQTRTPQIGHDQGKIQHLATMFEQTIKNQQKLLRNQVSSQQQQIQSGENQNKPIDQHHTQYQYTDSEGASNMISKIKNRPITQEEIQIHRNQSAKGTDLGVEEKAIGQ